MPKKIVLILLLTICTSLSSSAQYYEPFILGQSLPLFQNASFSGTLIYPRITTGLVMKGFTSPSLFSTTKFYTSFDQYIPAIRCGFGFVYSSTPDIFTPFKVQRNQFELALSPKIKLAKKRTLSLGGSIGIGTPSYRVDSLNKYGPDGINPSDKITYSVSALYNSATFYVGYSFREYSSVNVESMPAMQGKYNFSLHNRQLSTLQLAYVFRKKKSDKVTFSPALIVQYYHLPNFSSVVRYQLNLNFKRNFFFYGFGFGSTSLFAMMGFQGEKIRLAYAGSLIADSNNPEIFYQEIVFSYLFFKRKPITKIEK